VGHGADQRRRRRDTPRTGQSNWHGGFVPGPGAGNRIREYQQLSPLMPPGALDSYTIRVAPVVDFRAGYDAARWSELWEEFQLLAAEQIRVNMAAKTRSLTWLSAKPQRLPPCPSVRL